MRHVVIGLTAFSMLWSGIALAAAVSSGTTERVRLLGEQSAKAAAGKTGEYARALLDSAQASISAAQIAVAAGNEKEALQKAELAELQLGVADAKAAEKEILEQVAVRRNELKKLEAQLERYRQGEEN